MAAHWGVFSLIAVPGKQMPLGHTSGGTLWKRKVSPRLCIFTSSHPFPIRCMKKMVLHHEEEKWEAAGWDEKSLGFCRAVGPALCPLPGELTPGAGQEAHMGTRDWDTEEGSIWRDVGSGTAFPVPQEGLRQLPARSAEAGRVQLYFGQVRDGEKKSL